MHKRTQLILCSALLATVGCSNSGQAGADGGGDGADLAVSNPTDMALQPGEVSMRLISSTFNIPPGVEKYQCERLTIPADMYIVRVTPVSPTGVHHEVLAIDTGGMPDGTTACDASSISKTKNLYASGINSPSLKMPDNVALKIGAGQQIQLNLHLLNANPNTAIDATAAIDVVLAKNPTGYELAGVPFIGNVNFTVPPGGSTVTGSCTVSNDTKLFAVFPHMHQIGKHIKVVAGGTTVWDDDYDFQDQRFGFYPNWPAAAQEIALKKGDKIDVTCTFGPTLDGKSVKFGDSSTDEMCFGISYMHPAINTVAGSAFCVF